MAQNSRRTLLKAGGSSAVALAMAGCIAHDRGSLSSSPPDGSKNVGQTYKYDSARTGTFQTPLPKRNAEVKWSYTVDTDNAIIMSWPAVVDGTLFVGIKSFGHSPGSVLSLNASTGEKNWGYETHANASAPNYDGNALYIGSNNIFSLHSDQGSKRWGFSTNSGIASAPAVVNGRVFSRSGGTIYALDSSNGEKQWSNDRGSRTGSPVAVFNETVFSGSAGGNNEVVAVESKDGTEKWRKATEGGVTSSPSVTQGMIFVSDHKGDVYALRTSDGAEKWRNSLGQEISSPTIDSDRVYLRSETKVIALKRSSGEVAWKFSAKGTVNPMPSLGKYVAVAKRGGVAILDANDGNKEHEFSLPKKGDLMGTAVIRGAIYFGSVSSGTLRLKAIRD